MKADKYIIRFINKGNVLVMYNSSRTILVQEVNNHDWFFYKLSGQSLNNGSIFSIQNNIFICEIYTGFPMPMMLPSPSGLCYFNFVQYARVCNLSTCGFMCVLHGAFHRCCPTKKIICQQVQHNFEQYITRLKKKFGQQEKNTIIYP